MADDSGGFRDLVQRTWAENRLFSVLLELTYRCNLDCFFCYNDRKLQGTELSLAQYRSLLADLADLGTLNLILSGGEPLAHPDFFAVGACARDLGFVVRVKSNGHALRPAVAERLRDEVDPYLVEVSLHGATPATHDRQTRIPGSFARLLQNLEAMRRLGLRAKLNAVLTRWNEHEIEEMLALGRRLGLTMQVDTEVTPRDDGDRDTLEIAPSAEAVRRLFELQGLATHAAECPPAPTEKRGLPPVRKHCGAGSSTVAIDPYGNVYPCVQWRRRLGNLHETPIGELWRHAPVLGEVRRLAVEVATNLAARGPDHQLMAFCPGIAEAATGSPIRLYEGAERRLAEGRALLRATLPTYPDRD